MGNKFQNDQSFGTHLFYLLEILFYFYLTPFDVLAGLVFDEN